MANELYLTDMLTQHYVTHTALSLKAHGLKVHIIAEGCAAPMKALSKMALYGLKIRFSVESKAGFRVACNPERRIICSGGDKCLRSKDDLFSHNEI